MQKKSQFWQHSTIMELNGKTVWITGASSGIGAALAVALSVKGCSLILSARRREQLQEVAGQCHTKAMIVVMDVSDQKSIIGAWQEIQASGGMPDILINNSGISQRSAALETQLETDRRIMEVNYFGAVTLTKLVAPYLVQKGSGMIVNISSLSGKFGWKLRSSYAASKFALLGFFESLRAELEGSGVEVLNVIPGRIRTEIAQHAVLGDGSAYAKSDRGQETGIPVEVCAGKIVRAMEKNKKEIVIARIDGLMIHIRYWMPWLYYRIAAKRDPNK